MGGMNVKLEGESLEEVLKKFAKIVDYNKEHDIVHPRGEFAFMEMTNVSIGFKQKNGKWMGFGNNGIEVAVGTLHGFPKGKCALFVRFE